MIFFDRRPKLHLSIVYNVYHKSNVKFLIDSYLTLTPQPSQFNKIYKSFLLSNFTQYILIGFCIMKACVLSC